MLPVIACSAAALRPRVGPLVAPPLLRRHPFGRRRLLRPPLYWRPAASLENFLHRRTRRRPVSLFGQSFGHRVPPRPLLSKSDRPVPRLPAFGHLWRAAMRRLPLRPLEALVRSRLGPTPLAPDRLRFHTPANRLPPAALLVRHLMRRLARGFPLLRLVNGLFLGRHRLLAKQGLLSCLLRGRGRFTRVQMASSAVFRRGSVPLSTVDLPLDSGSATAYLKYGACTVRLWIRRA